MVALHLGDVCCHLFHFIVRGVSAEGEVEGALNLLGQGFGFFFESEGKGDGAISDEVAVHHGEGLG